MHVEGQDVMEKVMILCMNFGMGVKVRGVSCNVTEWVKFATLRWFGHVIRMNKDDLVKVCQRSTVGKGIFEKTIEIKLLSIEGREVKV